MKRKRMSVYKPGLPMRLFVLSMGLLVAGIHTFALRSVLGTGEMPFLIFPFLLLVDGFLLWWSIIFMTQSRVTLFEEGIEVERGGSKLFSTWDNVSHLGIKGGGKNSRRGLFLHEKVSPETTGLVDKLFFGRSTNFLPVGQFVRLPREWRIFSRKIDTNKLLNSEFGQELYRYAPHLFEEYDEWKPKNQLRDDYFDEPSDWIEDEQRVSDERYR
ncbi:MAG: hypothetical protein WBC91_24775 [Phototrophicaceae bacterium]